MKYIPILYSTPMVQAAIEDRKTKTRRLKGLELINKYPDHWLFESIYVDTKGDLIAVFEDNSEEPFQPIELKCPYGKPGDVLWVRESFCEPWLYDGCEKDYYFKATDSESDRHIWRTKWKPSIHMPKIACRIFLEITDVTVERLHDISEADAIAEGILFYDHEVLVRGYKDYWQNPAGYGDPQFDYPTVSTAIDSFNTLWCKINGAESWSANPWVWVISFKKIERPAGFLT